MIKVFIAAPMYTSGTMGGNLRKVLTAARHLIAEGFLPFIPHLYFFWDLMDPQPRDYWLLLDGLWVEECDCVYRMNGESKGADAEVIRATRESMPVFYELGDVIAYYKHKG